jgi:CheY-like chemotaxis protein
MAQILILEQHKRQFQFVKECVEAKGHKLFWSAKPDEALQSLEKFAFDLIICAVNLDDADVFDFLRAVKLNKTTADIPFVFCSADQDRTQRFATTVIKAGGKALGARKYILPTGFGATAELWSELQDCLPEESLKKDVLGGPVKTYSIAQLSSTRELKAG